MRFIIVGAGAIGGVLAAQLHQAGQDVLLVARGANYKAIRGNGLTYKTFDTTKSLFVPVVNEIAEVAFREGDFVILAIKSQDTQAALRQLEDCGSSTVPVLCAQNGVENERMALRTFSSVYGAHILLPATYLVPGHVELHCDPSAAIVDVGRYPSGSDATSNEFASILSSSGISSKAMSDIMRWKYRKLVGNLGGGLDALFGDGHRRGSIDDRAKQEAIDCFVAAGIDVVSQGEYAARRKEVGRSTDHNDVPRAGSSVWQSLERGIGSIETDYLNGEITMLGRLWGVPTPVNTRLQQLGRDAARNRRAPGSYSSQDFWQSIG